MRHLSLEHHLSQQLIQRSLDKISNDISEAMQDHSEMIKSKVLERSQSLVVACDQDSSRDLVLSGEKPSGGKRPERADNMSPTALRIQRIPQRKRLSRYGGQSYWFGKIMVSVLEIYAGDDLTHILTEWLYIPSPWPFRLGRGLKIRYLKSIVARESPKLTLRPIQILPGHSPVICSIESHDIKAAIQLLHQKTVYPSAVTMDGKNLLHLVSAEMFKIVSNLFNQSGPWSEDSFGLAACSAEQIEQSKNLFGLLQALYSYLLAQGVDPAQRCIEGGSAIENFFLFTLIGFERVFPSKIYDCLISSVSAAQDNPYHVSNAMSVGGLLHSYSHKHRTWDFYPFIERMLDDQEWIICTNDGISHANAVALRFTFTLFEPDSDEFEQWNPTEYAICTREGEFFQRRLKIVQHLTKNVRDNIPDLKAPGTLAEIVNSITEALQTSLIYASRIKGLRGTSEHMSFVRQCIVEEVTTLLDVGIPLLKVREDLMLDWCEEWEVLDIWVESLRRLGVQIPRKTRKAWKENKIYYSYLDIRTSTVT